MEERAHVRYSAVSSREEDLRDRELPERRYSRDSHDLRYEFNIPETVPWKSIFLAFFLLSFGTVFLLISHFMFTGHMGGDSSQAYGFLVLGILIFLPGFYETRIAYYSWRGAKGDLNGSALFLPLSFLCRARSVHRKLKEPKRAVGFFSRVVPTRIFLVKRKP